MPFRRQHEGSDLCAIFVHAGAGYHSVANEKLHLGAVNDAAKVAMAILKNGGDAVDAVEMAIRLLEDREITNAGYGSNLTIEGHVECDATMVDHLGRSGAVGAVSQIKNPIALARLVLEASSTPLSLQRVPPNLIVGVGATEFAAENGLPILPHDYLISDSARNRWLSWRQDLLEAEVEEQAAHNSSSRKPRTEYHNPTTISPPTSPVPTEQVMSTLSALPFPTRPLIASTADLTSLMQDHEPDPFTVSRQAVPPMSYLQYSRVADKWTPDDTENDVGIDDSVSKFTSPAKRQRLDGSFDTLNEMTEGLDVKIPSHKTLDEFPQLCQRDDHITDTVGAIAIDCFGNIAAGSSSGGIGMKHRGRCGPAALVGIGTAVVPVDPNDVEKACVATVTSGTGEHMATTAAAATAADRIYLRVRKEGSKLKACDEDEALHSMIKNDFMKHPGVQNQPCAGAIGVLAVKKTRDGIYFYFGHNTDSFALASMHSEERKPVCTMSRSKGNGAIAQGGRAAKAKRAK